MDRAIHDLEPNRIGNGAGVQIHRDQAQQVAPARGRAREDDFGLVRLRELDKQCTVGLSAKVVERGIVGKQHLVRAVRDDVLRQRLHTLAEQEGCDATIPHLGVELTRRAHGFQ